MTGAAWTGSQTFDSAEALALCVAEWLCGLAQASNRDFAVCLSGGSTPRRLYETLATPAIASRFPWRRSHWFWGDERFVLHDDPDSNFRMAREAFLSRVPVPGCNIHAIPTEDLSPEQAAAAYETTLKRFYGADALAPDRPLFDVTSENLEHDGDEFMMEKGAVMLLWAAVGACRFRPERPVTLSDIAIPAQP